MLLCIHIYICVYVHLAVCMNVSMLGTYVCSVMCVCVCVRGEMHECVHVRMVPINAK